MLQLALKPRRRLPALAGHPWIYRDEVLQLPHPLPDGTEADVLDPRGEFLGRGLVSAESQIVCRIYTRQPEPLDRDFFRRRLVEAGERRAALGLPNEATDSFRLVYAEGDLLPGLTVDRYADYLVVQTTTAGMELRKALIVELLQDLYQPAGICQRNDVAVRKHEGLPLESGWLAGTSAETIRIRENHVAYDVHPLGTMKTGHFFDQRDNRRWLEPLAAGRDVLDMFCYTGGFGLTAARAGARSVLAVDSSEPALEMARANAELNQVAERTEYRAGDGFDVLRELDQQGRQFGLVVLDPPAFAKSKSHIASAVRGYKQINLRALRMLPPGGILLTCSCSFQIDRSDFRHLVLEAAADARRVVRVLGEGAAAADHPALLNVPETSYLKSLLLEVVERF